MVHTELKFNLGKKPMAFDLVHNLDEFGLTIESALVNWAARTKKHSINSFCDYVESKDKQIICMPKSLFDERINVKP